MRTVTTIVLTVIAATAVSSIAACGTDTEASAPNTNTTTHTAEPTARGAPTAGHAPEQTGTPASDNADSLTACAETREWETADQTSEPYSTDALYLVRVGRHDCYDRVVLDVNGQADVGYTVRYVSVVTADGSGEPMPVAGNAALAVVVHAPPQGLDGGGHQPGRTFADTGDHLYSPAQLTGWHSLRAVRYAGFFEGQTTLAIGVRATLPFRVSSQLDQTDHIRRIVIDIAHNH
jgi:hypothetical protein